MHWPYIHFFFYLLELYTSWEDLLHWSESILAAKKLENDISLLKDIINKLGARRQHFDSELMIQNAIDELKVSHKIYYFIICVKTDVWHTKNIILHNSNNCFVL